MTLILELNLHDKKNSNGGKGFQKLRCTVALSCNPANLLSKLTGI